jgi:hypothetical protein
MTAPKKFVAGVKTFVSDVSAGFFEISHHGFALTGLAAAFVVIALAARPDLRAAGEAHLMEWLQNRQVASLGMEPAPEAIERATASDPKALPQAQANVTFWLSKKYRVAPEPLSVLVAEAYEAGERAKIDPTLILAIMAMESSFNPFAQSTVGAQGLMQVMTQIHADKYENFGGQWAAFDPVTNLRVGIKVLQECIARAGSLEGGLRYYVGAANLPDDGGYAAKVLAEHSRLQQVAKGVAVPLVAPPVVTAQTPAAPAAQNPEKLPTVSPATVEPMTPANGQSGEGAPSASIEKVAMLSGPAARASAAK